MTVRTADWACIVLGAVLSSALAGDPLAAAAPAGSDGALVKVIKVQPDLAPDCSSLKAIAESVTRDCKTNDAKAIAIYNFVLLTHYHQPEAVEDGGIAAIKEINNYGCSYIWGHPQGPTGARTIIELIEELVILGGGYGMFNGCAAGDTGAAIILRVDC
jgi:hypothetical protein